MKKFKKILLTTLSFALVAILSIAGTIAYLTHTDAQVNVFTTGNVEIDLWEDFGDNSGVEKLLPATGSAQNETIKNAVEKEVYVTNTGSEDAYVRVHIAVPTVLDDKDNAGKNALHFNYKNDNVGAGKWDWSKTTGADYTGNWNTYSATIDEIEYTVYVVTYEDKLTPGETTVDAIHQMYLDSKVTNEDIARYKETLGDKWNVYVVAEGGQAAGFDNAYDALNTQFGVPGAYNVGDWKTSKNVTFQESKDGYNGFSDATALTNALERGIDAVMIDDITVDELIVIPDDANTTLDLNNKTLTGDLIAKNANLTIKNGTINDTTTENSGIEINAGTLTLEDVKITSDRHPIRIDGEVTATINGGTYKVTGAHAMTTHTLNVSGNANVTVNGGTFIGIKGTPNGNAMGGAAVKVQAGATVTINGGTFSGGVNDTLASEGTLIVKGGTFDQDPSKYVADGFTASETEINGVTWWTVSAN